MSALPVGAKCCGLGFSQSQAFQKPKAYQERELHWEIRLTLNMLNGAQMYETENEQAADMGQAQGETLHISLSLHS